MRAIAPPGWDVAFKANYKQVASVDVDANHIQDISISMDPPDETAAGTYRIPVIASTDASSSTLNLEVHITGYNNCIRPAINPRLYLCGRAFQNGRIARTSGLWLANRQKYSE